VIDYVALSSALSGHLDPGQLDGETREAFDNIGPVGRPEPSEADLAADRQFETVNRFIEEKVADMEAKGIAEGSPEEHQYHLDLEALRPLSSE